MGSAAAFVKQANEYHDKAVTLQAMAIDRFMVFYINGTEEYVPVETVIENSQTMILAIGRDNTLELIINGTDADFGLNVERLTVVGYVK